MKLSGWGRFPVHETRLTAPRSEAALVERIVEGGLVARGNGRAYGDSAVGRPNTVHMRNFNRMIAFDDATGLLVAEAGVMLADIIASFLPRGWFPAVTPGTKFVTLGGMIAADVHGKNHHRDGSIGRFVDWIDVMDVSSTVQRYSREHNTELFEWTVGGMGLTGVILRAAMRLRPVETGWIKQETIAVPNLDAVMDAFENAEDATYSVAWIDCMSQGDKQGRSLVMLGEHAKRDELSGMQQARPYQTPVSKLKISVPFDAPSFLLNRATVRTLNHLYHWNGMRQAGVRLVDWDSYFYPLDAVLDWNRIYGRKGFAQFQCVLPLEQSRKGIRALLQTTSERGIGSCFSVLKRLGEQEGRFSFPMPGYTLALDFPVNRRTLELMDALDRVTLEHGGRIYLAKDGRMTAEALARSDRRATKFAEMRDDRGLRARFQSAQSERLAL